MKWVIWLVLAAGAASAGCLNLSGVKEQVQPKVVAEAKKPAVPPPPVVLPEQVNENNLAQTLPAFQAELDYAAIEPPLQPEAPSLPLTHQHGDKSN